MARGHPEISNVVAKSQGNDIILTWTGNVLRRYYRVEVFCNGVMHAEITTTIERYVFYDVKHSSQYYFVVHYGNGLVEEISNIVYTGPAASFSPKHLAKDSGIGSSLGSKLSTTKKSEKSRTGRETTTVHGSLPDDMSGEQPSLSRLKKNPAFDPDALKLQKQEMRSLSLGPKEPRNDKISRWLQGGEIDLAEGSGIPEGISTTVDKLMMSDEISGYEIDLGEDIPEGISTSVGKLTIRGFNPLPETFEIFSHCLHDINLQVHELDLSNNAVLREAEIKHIGAIVRHSKVSNLLLQGCELNHNTMLNLQKCMNNTTLTNLDLSKSNESEETPTELEPDSMAVLGNIVSDCKVHTLALRNRSLRQEHMSRLRRSLAGTKLFEIDVSGNVSLGLDGIAELAGLVRETEVKELILRKCGLKSLNLMVLKEIIGDSKLTTLDVSENYQLGTAGVASLGGIAKQCTVRDLVLRDCSLTPDHMTALNQSLDGFMLMELDIGKKKALAQALSSFESDSTEASDDTGYTEEDDQSEESPKETPESQTAGCLRDKEQEYLSSFQPEQLIISLLSNVNECIKMDNWKIGKEGKKLLEDEMRTRKLTKLEISWGRGRQEEVISLSTLGHREHAGEQMGRAKKKISSTGTHSTTLIKQQGAEERGKDILEKISEEKLQKQNPELEGTSAEREDAQAPDGTEENTEATNDQAPMFPACSRRQLHSIQDGSQATYDWQEEPGAIGGRPASTDPATKFPVNAGQLQIIQGRNQAAKDWQEARGAVGGRPAVGRTSTLPSDSPKKPIDFKMQEQQFCNDDVLSPSADLLLHLKSKDYSEETPPAKEMNPEAKGTSVERPRTIVSPRVQKGKLNSKDTRDSDAVKQVVGTVGWSPQRTAQRKYIDKEGGEINICGCKIAFPRDSLKEEKEIQVSICPDVEEDLDISSFNYDTIAVTPTFEFKPSVKFEKPVTVEMATCLRAIGDNKIPVVVLSKKLGKPWEVLAQAFVGNQGVIQFETLHFCKLRAIVNKLYAYFFGWSLKNELYINKDATAIASVFTKEFKNQMVEDELRKKGYAAIDVTSEEFKVKVGEEVEFWVECKKLTQMSITPSKAFLAITEDILEKEKNQEHFEMDPSLDEHQGKVRFCYHVKSTHEKEKRLPFRLSWPILETHSAAGRKVQHDGVHDLKKVTNVQVTIDNRENIAANNMVKSGGKIDVKAENTTMMASQRQQSADDIPNTSRGNVGTS